MTYTTYFEIGGQLIETFVDTPTRRPPSNPLMEMAKKHGVPKPMVKAAERQLSRDTGYDISRANRGLGRVKRAQWAFQTAAGLALADGPLPFGDIAAVGVLTVYGTYEAVNAFSDLAQ